MDSLKILAARHSLQRHKWLVVVFLLFSSSFDDVMSQTEQVSSDRTHHLGVLLGFGFGSYREDLVVPISFDGPAFVLGGQYSVGTARSSLQLPLSVSVALLKNRFSHTAYASSLELRPSWTKMMWNSAPGEQIWCGVALPMTMRNLFLDSWDDSHLYWFTAHSIAVAGEYHRRLPWLGRSVIRLDLPLIGFVSRPPDYRYKKQEALSHLSYHFSAPNKSFALQSIWRYQSPRVQLLINRSSGESLLHVGFECELDHSPEPKDVWILTTRLFFSYQWRIG